MRQSATVRLCPVIANLHFVLRRISLKSLAEFTKKMRDAENETHEGKRKAEALWPIMRLNHARSRYVYELFYKRKAISRKLYDWLVKEKYADAGYVHKPLHPSLLVVDTLE